MSDDSYDAQVCRDFIRGACARGKRCKYDHPNRNKDDERELDSMVFCHDFQNQGCTRNNCKFAHYTKAEEATFRQTGHLPEVSEHTNGGGDSYGPLCKDFTNGVCTRGDRCRFRHDNPELTKIIAMNVIGPPPPPPVNSYPYHPPHHQQYAPPQFQIPPPPPPPPPQHQDVGYSYDYDLKRRRMVEGLDYYDSRVITDDTTLLRRKVASLEKQVVDLTSTNEVLLEQNARYRMINKSMSMSPVSLPTLPAGSLVSMSQPIVTPAVTLATLANTGQPLQSMHIAESVPAAAPQVGMTAEISAAPQQPQASIAGPPPTAAAAAAPTAPQLQPQALHAPPLQPPQMATMSAAAPGVVPVSMNQGMAPMVTMSPMVSIAQNHSGSSSMIAYPMVSRSLQQT